jgi:hypothetical protein
MDKRILALMLAATPGCDRDRPAAPTSEQSQQLDEAEAMLNDMAQNEEGAAPEGTAPGNGSSEAGAE